MIELLLWPPAQLAIALALGLVFGSFVNVCIHRLPDRRSVVWPGSECPACHAGIRWYDNIPVLSWMLLAGRCRRCRWPIPWRYPLVEATAGALLVALVLLHGLGARWAALSWLALSILALVPIDFRHGILPDAVTLPGIAAGLVFSFFGEDPGPRGALMGALAGGMVPYAVRTLYMGYARARTAWQRRGAAVAASGAEGAQDGSADAAGGGIAVGPQPGEHEHEHEEEHEEERREGMGLGDVKMLAMVGAFLGVSKVLLTMLLGSLIGTLYVLPLLLLGRHTMKTPIPFGPFLGIAALVSLFAGDRIIDWYLGLVVTLPFVG